MMKSKLSWPDNILFRLLGSRRSNTDQYVGLKTGVALELAIMDAADLVANAMYPAQRAEDALDVFRLTFVEDASLDDICELNDRITFSKGDRILKRMCAAMRLPTVLCKLYTNSTSVYVRRPCDIHIRKSGPATYYKSINRLEAVGIYSMSDFCDCPAAALKGLIGTRPYNTLLFYLQNKKADRERRIRAIDEWIGGQPTHKYVDSPTGRVLVPCSWSEDTIAAHIQQLTLL